MTTYDVVATIQSSRTLESCRVSQCTNVSLGRAIIGVAQAMERAETPNSAGPFFVWTLGVEIVVHDSRRPVDLTEKGTV